MNIWAISDLHLSIGLPAEREKPMEIFHHKWKNHADKIAQSWHASVKERDVVLIPGDISWANSLEEAQPSLEWLDQLPGRKILLKGNHDNWWGGINKLKNALPESIYALQNNVIMIGNIAICGARGWTYAIMEDEAHRDKMVRREALRLERSLKAVPKEADYTIAMLHYPPFQNHNEQTIFLDLLLKSSVNTVVYGHLHGEEALQISDKIIKNKEFILVSADKLAFSPIRIYNGDIKDDHLRYVEEGVVNEEKNY